MATPALTYGLGLAGPSDNAKIYQDLKDLLNAITDGTKDLTIKCLILDAATGNPCIEFKVVSVLKSKVFVDSADNFLKVQVAGTTALTIDTSQRVYTSDKFGVGGIPVRRGHVYGTSGDIGSDTIMTDFEPTLVVEDNAANVGFMLLSPAGGNSRIMFADNTDFARIGFDHTTNIMRMDVRSAGVLTLHSSGLGVLLGSTVAPSAGIHVIKITEQQRVGYSQSFYLSTTIDSGGSASLALNTSPDFAITSPSESGLRLALYGSNSTSGKAEINFDSVSSTSVRRTFASIDLSVVDRTNTSEDANLNFDIIVAGSSQQAMSITKDGLLFKSNIYIEALNANEMITRPAAAGYGSHYICPNGTNFGTMHIFSTDYKADATNYESVEIRKQSAGAALIKVTKGGTGTYRNLEIHTNNKKQVTLDTSGNFNIETGELSIVTTGKGLSIKSSTNPRLGTATLVAGTKTVSNTSVLTGDHIMTWCITPGGTQGFLSTPVASIVNATSFVINSSNAADTSVVGYMIVRPI